MDPQTQPTTPAQAPPPAQQGVALIDAEGNPGLVAPDQVDAALATGKYQRAYQMQDKDGNIGFVAENKIADARKQNYAVVPQPGVQRMATPQGQLTYATPAEVEPFKQSGHVVIEDNGNFRVDPLDGEENTETMDRAASIARGLPKGMLEKAIQAEKSSITAKRVAANLTIGPLAATAVSMAPAVAANEAVLAAPAVIGTVGPPLARGLGTMVRLARTPAGQVIMKKAGQAIGTAAAGAGFGAAAHYIQKWLSQ